MVLTVFLCSSKNFRGAAGQRASGPFFKNHSFRVYHAYKKKERAICLDLRNCNGNITRNASSVPQK